MISIIVSSINPEQNKIFRENIHQTIGIPYELLIHDNRDTKWGLCKLYNFYAKQSKYDILCFAHEDILFQTKDWGTIISDFFHRTSNVGVIGFAGATLKTKTLSGWESHKTTTRMNVAHGKNKIRKRCVNPFEEEFSEVLTLDGLALIVSKQSWEKYPFDEETFQGFHLYDLDFSFQIAQEYKNYVCFSVNVKHLSKGAYGNDWYKASLLFQEKWKDKLPYSIHLYPSSVFSKCEAVSLYRLTRGELTYSYENKNLSSVFLERLILSYRLLHLYYTAKLVKHFFKALQKRFVKGIQNKPLLLM